MFSMSEYLESQGVGDLTLLVLVYNSTRARYMILILMGVPLVRVC